MSAIRETEDRVSTASMLAVVVMLLVATTENWGSFTWTGLVLLSAALAFCVWLHLGRDPFRGISGESLLTALLIGSVAAWCCLTLGQSQGRVRFTLECGGQAISTWRLTPPGMALKILAPVALLIALAQVIKLRPALRRAAWICLIVIAVAARVMVTFSSPSPEIDVFVSQAMGAKGLLGRYATVSDVAPGGRAEQMGFRVGDIVVAQDDDGPGSSRDMVETFRARPTEHVGFIVLRKGRFCRLTGPSATNAPDRTLADELGVKVARAPLSVYSMTFPSPYQSPPFFDHYGYPPLTVYANALSFMLFHDVRGLWILADMFGAACIFLLARRATPGEKGERIGILAALVWLFLPRSLFVIEQSWTEPLCVATLGALVLARGRWAGGAALGLWLASKQYVPVAVPLVLKLRRLGWREWSLAVVVAAATFVPFVIWDWQGMYHDVLGFFLTSQTRPDGLSLVGALKRFEIELPWALVAPIWLAGLAFFTWRMKRTTAGWLFSAASLYLFFFMFGKQAFMNYFYLILFILLLAVAATKDDETPAMGKDGNETRKVGSTAAT